MSKEEIVAMAVAAIAEECGTEPQYVVVRSFREVKKSSLEQFIEDNHINFTKYQVEELQ